MPHRNQPDDRPVETLADAVVLSVDLVDKVARLADVVIRVQDLDIREAFNTGCGWLVGRWEGRWDGRWDVGRKRWTNRWTSIALILEQCIARKTNKTLSRRSAVRARFGLLFAFFVAWLQLTGALPVLYKAAAFTPLLTNTERLTLTFDDFK